jgi:hypothetical protein
MKIKFKSVGLITSLTVVFGMITCAQKPMNTLIAEKYAIGSQPI